jgi:predicted nucleotidyltransferase component of viral defense system
MKLHDDKDSFVDILRLISHRTGIRADILEKDYYVTLLLKELANKQHDLPAFFKGGTALYKALGTIRRFSEDIDLTVRINDCSNTQAKRRLERASKEYVSLPRTGEKSLEHNRRGSISCAYDYAPIVDIAEDDPLQRFGHVRIEATSFTVSEPTTTAKIAPEIYLQANNKQKMALADIFDVNAFTIETICIERIFIDKIFAAEFYHERMSELPAAAFDVAKHLYDIAVLSELDTIKAILADNKALAKMIEYKRREESIRTGSDLNEKSFSDFSIVRDMAINEKLSSAFALMQDIYVFNDSYKISYKKASKAYVELFPSLIRSNR